MPTFTLIIRDEGDRVEFEGRIDPPEAIDEGPTPSLFIGTYLAANIEQVMRDAGAWAAILGRTQAEDEAPQIITDARGVTV